MEKKSKKSILIGITILFLLMLLLLGLTYAYYRTIIIGNLSSNPSLNAEAKNMKIVYSDGTSTVNMDGAIEPGFEATKTFYVENTGKDKVSYSIIIDNMSNGFERNKDWQYTLTENGTKIADGNLAVGTYQILAGSRSIEGTKGAKNTYILTITYINSSEDQSIDMGAMLSLRLNISEEQYTWESAPEGSLLYALKNNQPKGSQTTTPGRAPSGQNEARLLTTEDDYGNSYVYRGNVTNNYVTFSNMCWRIVRVQGDGTIKLALADVNHPCGTDNGYSTEDEDSAFITSGSFGANYGQVGHLKFDYQTYEGSNVYQNNVFLLQDTLSIDTSKLVKTDWCEDTSVSNNESFGMLVNQGYSYSYNKQDYYDGLTDDWYLDFDFSSTNRLNNATANPTLKCNFKGIEIEEFADKVKRKTESHRYNGYFGMLTADELSFAGAYNSSTTYNYYLTTNAKSTYWLLTPAQFQYYEYLYNVITSTGKFDKMNDASSYSASIRPSIVLRNDILLDSNTSYVQDGTIDKPYVVE